MTRMVIDEQGKQLNNWGIMPSGTIYGPMNCIANDNAKPKIFTTE